MEIRINECKRIDFLGYIRYNIEIIKTKKLMSDSQVWITIRKKLISAILTIVFTFGFFGAITYALSDCVDYLDEGTCTTDVTCEWNDPVCSEIVVEPTTTLDACENNVTSETCETNTSCQWNEEYEICFAGVQMIGVQEVNMTEGWEPDMLQTYGAKFLVRGKEALTWALNIDDEGFDSQAIESSYLKVLTIVNSLFILGLLAIAAMWMFSIVIPRRYLKQVILVYAAAVIFVNFAMPMTKLMIDGTNLLQKTLLSTDGGTIAITDIVEVPTYEEAVGYQSTIEDIELSKELNVGLTTEAGTETEIAIGEINTNEQEVVGTMTDGTDTYDIALTIPVSEDNPVNLIANQQFTIAQTDSFSPNSEQTIFGFLLITATGLAYLLLALIFVLRIVILWALLILSPILFL